MNLLMAALIQQAWAMEPSALERIASVLMRHAVGLKLDAEAVSAAVGDAPIRAAERRAAASANGGVAVIPVYGTLAYRAQMVASVSGAGGTSTAMLRQAIEQAAADPSVAAIALDIDSPGGSVDGVTELVDAIYAARQSKPVVAVANTLAASAAYWVASAASEISITPSGQAGSVGVVAVRRYEGADANGGGVEIIHAGEFKAEGMAPGPLTEDARAHIQSIVDTYYGAMVKSIARNRGVPPETVRADYGKGRVFAADEAVRRGMADRIETLDAAVARLANPRRRSRVGMNANALRIATLS